MKTSRITIDFIAFILVAAALILAYLKLIDWWVAGLFILSKFTLKIHINF